METKTAAPKMISDSLKNGMIGLQEAEKPRLQTKEAGQEELDDEEQRPFKEEEVGMMMMQRDHDGKRETIKEEEEEEIEDSFNNNDNNKNERKEESGPHRLAAVTSTNGASASSSSASQPQKQNLFESSRSRMYTVAGKIKQQSANNLHEKVILFLKEFQSPPHCKTNFKYTQASLVSLLCVLSLCSALTLITHRRLGRGSIQYLG